MSYDFEPFLAFWQSNRPAFVQRVYDAVTAALPHYAALPREQLVGSIERKTDIWHDLLRRGDVSALLERTRALVANRVGDEFPMMAMVRTGDIYRDQLVRLLHQYEESTQHYLPLSVAEQIEQWARADRDVVLEAYGGELERIRAALSARIERLEQQKSLIDALSAPIVPITDATLMLPLVGLIDDGRAARIIETALLRVSSARAETLIVDLTGVAEMDVRVAQLFVQMARSARMLGARTVLVGISPATAHALTLQDVDLRGLVIYANLQAAVQQTLRSPVSSCAVRA